MRCFELLSQEVSHPPVFDLINGLSCLIGHLRESNPNEHRTPTMISYHACQPTLTLFKPGHLFDFAVKWLNFPSPVTHLLYP